jgi:hypothetical protein
VRSAIIDTAVVTGRNLRHFIPPAGPADLSTIQPVIFVLLFVYVFIRAPRSFGGRPGTGRENCSWHRCPLFPARDARSTLGYRLGACSIGRFRVRRGLEDRWRRSEALG